VDHALGLDALLDQLQRALGTALRRVGEVVAVGRLEERQDFFVEHFAPRAAGQRPSQVDVLRQEPLAEVDGPLLLREDGEVVELERRDLVFLDVVLQFVHEVVDVPQRVLRGPHLRAGAERAAVRAAARREDGHVPLGADAVRLPRLPEFLEIALRPVGPRDRLELLDPGQPAVVDEFAGVVERVGRNVNSVAPGDSVFGNSQSGAYAEYLAVKSAAIAKKPSNLSYEEAASVPVAAQTAWQGLFSHAHLAQGQTVLIHGGAGSVGAYAVQLAAQAGAVVVVTATGEDEAYLKSLGANRVIDYQVTRFESELPDKVDVVFDLIGGETQQRSFQVLRKGGYLIAANQPVPQEQAVKHRVTGLMMIFVPSAEDLGRIAHLLEERRLRPDVATIYGLEETVRAWKDMAGGPESAAKTRRRHGKVVLRVA